MSIFPLIKNFQATSYNRAFVLNAIAGAVICALAIELRLTLEKDKTKYYGFWSYIYNEKKLSTLYKFSTTLLVTFIVSVLVYYSMYFIFLYGAGQLSSRKFTSIGVSIHDLFKTKI
jgi:hypothetical protein